MMTDRLNCGQSHCGHAENADRDHSAASRALLGEAVTGDIIDLFVLLAGVWRDPALPRGAYPDFRNR